MMTQSFSSRFGRGTPRPGQGQTRSAVRATGLGAAPQLEALESPLERLLAKALVAAELDVRDPAGARLRPDPILRHAESLSDLLDRQQLRHRRHAAETPGPAKKLGATQDRSSRTPLRRAPRPQVGARNGGTAWWCGRWRDPSIPGRGGCRSCRSLGFRRCVGDRGNAVGGAPLAGALSGSERRPVEVLSHGADEDEVVRLHEALAHALPRQGVGDAGRHWDRADLAGLGRRQVSIGVARAHAESATAENSTPREHVPRDTFGTRSTFVERSA
jgi:hypothetical protein